MRIGNFFVFSAAFILNFHNLCNQSHIQKIHVFAITVPTKCDTQQQMLCYTFSSSGCSALFCHAFCFIDQSFHSFLIRVESGENGFFRQPSAVLFLFSFYFQKPISSIILLCIETYFLHHYSVLIAITILQMGLIILIVELFADIQQIFNENFHVNSIEICMNR